MGFNKDTGLYELEDIAFVNTSGFSEAARHYKKHNCYTFEPEGSKGFQEFWDIEQDRRINGMTLPGKLITRRDEKTLRTWQEIQQVHITGKHYGFLNYGRMFITKDINPVEAEYLSGNKVKHTRKVGKKSIDFPRFIDGQYHYWHAKDFARKNGLNTISSKARRKGFSYMEGFDVADEINLKRDITCLVAAFDLKYLLKGNQIMPMAKRYLDWFEDHTDFGRGFLKEEKDHFKLGFKKEGQGHKEYGYKSELIAVSLMNNPDAAAGKDAIIIKFEESGKNPILKEALNITMSTTEDGSVTTGSIDIFGTGGTKDANWKDFEDIYYNPGSYNCLVFDNVWDEGLKGTGCGFFYPQQVGDPDFLDEHGNSQVEKALAYDTAQEEIKKKILGQSDFIRWRAQRARCGKEAFSSGSDNIFPTADIIDQKSRVELDPDYKYLARHGVLIRTDKGIRFKMNEALKAEGQPYHDPITKFPIKKGEDVHGCYTEYMSPFRDPSTGLIPKKLYRIWNDPYGLDKDSKDITTKDSIAAAYVYEVVNNVTPSRGDYIVASLIGRPSTMDEYNEMLLRMAQYWNAEVMFENDRGDVKGYFMRNKALHLLADEPSLEWALGLKGKTNRGKGINMTDDRKGHGALYLRDWIMKPRGKDIYGNERMNLHYMYDAALLSELLRWNLKGNFDRVSAMLVGMFDIKEQLETKIVIAKQANGNSFFSRKIYTNE